MEPLWYITKDGDATLYELYRRHYSSGKNKRPKIRQFVGPGQSIVLRTDRGDAGFVWRKFIDDSGQRGINCAMFRNESKHLSSELIRQADAIADFCWPGERHYTYVNKTAVRSKNPGYCFIRAGWTRCGSTKRGLLVLEKSAGLTNPAPAENRSNAMNDEDLTAFMQHWTLLHDPITTDSAAYHHARTAWQAALSHRDKRVAELEAVVAELPKTADGVPVVPKSVVYLPNGSKLWADLYAGSEVCLDTETDSWEVDLSEVWGLHLCYSTREAAEAARKEQP